jgi:hypothetical protein
VPREYSSGEQQQRGRVVRSAHPYVRVLLVQAAWRIGQVTELPSFGVVTAKTTSSEPWRTRSVGLGIEPLYASMRIVVSPSCVVHRRNAEIELATIGELDHISCACRRQAVGQDREDVGLRIGEAEDAGCSAIDRNEQHLLLLCIRDQYGGE